LRHDTFIPNDKRKLLKFEKLREIDDSSILLHNFTQSRLNCFVNIAYKNGLAQLLSGKTNIVSTFASLSPTNGDPTAADTEKNIIGAQHRKSVTTRIAIRFAILKSLEFHACDPLMYIYILM
jgi:hypothetical protein